MWCIGKNESIVSVDSISKWFGKLHTFAHIFCCDSITALGSFVVPDVNNIIDILSLSISISSYCLFPSSLSFWPFCTKSENFCTCSIFTSSMQIKNFTLLSDFCLILIIVSIYFSSNITTSASLLLTNVSISLFGSDLSSGTITISPLVTAK